MRGHDDGDTRRNEVKGNDPEAQIPRGEHDGKPGCLLYPPPLSRAKIMADHREQDLLKAQQRDKEKRLDLIIDSQHRYGIF